MIMKEYIVPKKIIAKKLSVRAEENLFNNTELQISTDETQVTVFENEGYVLLDFGLEISGGIHILTHSIDGGNCQVRVRFGESAAEAMAPIGYKNNVNAHTIKEFILDLPEYADIPCGETGFRFVYIEVCEHKQIRIKGIYAENTIYHAPTVWEYSGEDEKIRQIFEVAKRTIDLCVQNGYIYDGIKRDRLVWIGDIYAEIMALITLYGDVECIPNSLNFVRNKTPLSGWMNRIPSYSVWWIIVIADYYSLTKNEAFLIEQKEYFFALINQIDGYIAEDGKLLFEDKFIDLNIFKKPSEDAAVRALLLVACKKAKVLYEQFGEKDFVVLNIERKLRKIPVECFNCKTVAALKFWAEGTLSEEDKKVLLQNGNQGVSTFMSYFIFDAIGMLYGKEIALDCIKEYFGGMLEIGATTFWENYDLEWTKNSIKIDELPTVKKKDFHGDYGIACYTGYRMSLCHGWSSGIIKLIKKFTE